jgi:hypothetical protein
MGLVIVGVVVAAAVGTMGNTSAYTGDGGAYQGPVILVPAGTPVYYEVN